jgi:hypothetical protein
MTNVLCASVGAVAAGAARAVIKAMEMEDTFIVDG